MPDQAMAKMCDAELVQPLAEPVKEFQLPAELHGSRAAARPPPLTLQGISLDEQPRVGPPPLSPLDATARKRKDSPTLVEGQKPYYQQKKRIIAKQRTLPVPGAPRVGTNKRIGSNDLEITMNDEGANGKSDIPFPFMELPGEIRNMIYAHCIDMSGKQALLIHLPKTGTLRSSTRKARAAPGKYREPDDLEKKRHGRRVPVEDSTCPQLPQKESNRPFVGLTQVCRQIRKEFYPAYIAKQEVGLDMTNAPKYVETFFDPSVPFSYADAFGPTSKNMPFRGSITVAVADKILPIEKTVGWVDLLPLLNTWANSIHIEAGFGRYSSRHYHAQTDGEAKDLYRLYGRKVLLDRSCSEMNKKWRVVLRRRKLAAIRIHRQPGTHPKPYFHLIWRHEFRESWMTGEYSVVPGTVGGRATPGSWLWSLGFDRMEHFDVRVGAEQYPGEFFVTN